MEAQMINHFEDALAHMSEADFLSMWEGIKEDSREGILAVDFITNFSQATYKTAISFNWSGIDDEEFAFAGEYNFAMAA